MARVTVEDCVVKIPNRFELVLLAAQRARELSSGAEPTLDRENDKNPVIALREIADETIPVLDLREALLSGLQRHVEFDEPEDESMAILAAAEKEWAGVTGERQVESERAAEGISVVETSPGESAPQPDAGDMILGDSGIIEPTPKAEGDAEKST